MDIASRIKKIENKPICGTFFSELIKNSIKHGDCITFIAKGYSMYPAIENKGKVTIKKMFSTQIKVGDIVLGYSKENLLLHRVTYIYTLNNQKVFWVCGDADKEQTVSKIYEADLLAKVVAVQNSPLNCPAKLLKCIFIKLGFKIAPYLRPLKPIIS